MMNETRYRFRKRARVAGRHAQKGEMSLIEGGAVLAAAALLAVAVIIGGKYVVDLVHASQFKSEASMFHAGILNATQNDSDYSAETLQTLAQNHAFDAAGTRVAADKSAVLGLFQSPLVVWIGSVINADDSIVVAYVVPEGICAMTVAALSNVYSALNVNGVMISSPIVPFTSSAAATACAATGSMATIQLITTRT